MRKIALDRLDDLFAAFSASHRVYLPADTKAGAEYRLWEPGVKLSEALNTVQSPKDFFFPQTENLMDFKLHGGKIEILDSRDEAEDFVIFGIRACDVRALTVLDKVFLSDPADSYYQNRRSHGVIVSMACSRPAETCFCGTFGIDAANPEGDVVCWRTDGVLCLDARTEKGAALLAAAGKITEDCAPDAAKDEKKRIADRLKKLPLASLSADRFGGGKTGLYFDDPAWKSLSEACLGCGTCTFVCPTCQCYDIRDFDTGRGVHRYRCWDSCMYSEFTKMSAGQPRLTQLERFRQRFMHKLVYYPENNDGLFSCVGCGRCIDRCPIRMNIVKVMKTLGGGESRD